MPWGVRAMRLLLIVGGDMDVVLFLYQYVCCFVLLFIFGFLLSFLFPFFSFLFTEERSNK